jgi:hypothetical protein
MSLLALPDLYSIPSLSPYESSLSTRYLESQVSLPLVVRERFLSFGWGIGQARESELAVSDSR